MLRELESEHLSSPELPTDILVPVLEHQNGGLVDFDGSALSFCCTGMVHVSLGHAKSKENEDLLITTDSFTLKSLLFQPQKSSELK